MLAGWLAGWLMIVIKLLALMRFEIFSVSLVLIPLSRPLQFLVIRHLTLQSSGPASSTNLSRLLVPDMSSVQS